MTPSHLVAWVDWRANLSPKSIVAVVSKGLGVKIGHLDLLVSKIAPCRVA